MAKFKRISAGLIMLPLFSRFALRFRRIIIDQYLRNNQISFVSTPTFVGRWPIFNNHGKIIMGEKCRFREYRTRHFIGVTNSNAVLELGSYCFFNDGVEIGATKKISIGAYTKLGPGVVILDSNFHQVQETDDVYQAEVVIGRNVWVGQNAIVMPGVSIGDHSVIGANSVVTRSIPPKVIAAGSPAVVLKDIQCSDEWIRV